MAIHIHKIGDKQAAIHMIRYDYDEDRDEVPVIPKMTLDVRLARPFRMAKSFSPVGDCVRLSGPGAVHVSARAEGIFPIGTLELVQNGRVVASTDDSSGAHRLDLETDVRVDGNCWLAAACGGPHHFSAPSRHDASARRVFAHS